MQIVFSVKNVFKLEIDNKTVINSHILEILKNIQNNSLILYEKIIIEIRK